MDVQEGGASCMAPSSNDDGIMLMSKAIENKVGDDVVTSSLMLL